jgi:hypothetical protein
MRPVTAPEQDRAAALHWPPRRFDRSSSPHRVELPHLSRSNHKPSGQSATSPWHGSAEPDLRWLHKNGERERTRSVSPSAGWHYSQQQASMSARSSPSSRQRRRSPPRSANDQHQDQYQRVVEIPMRYGLLGPIIPASGTLRPHSTAAGGALPSPRHVQAHLTHQQPAPPTGPPPAAGASPARRGREFGGRRVVQMSAGGRSVSPRVASRGSSRHGTSVGGSAWGGTPGAPTWPNGEWAFESDGGGSALWDEEETNELGDGGGSEVVAMELTLPLLSVPTLDDARGFVEIFSAIEARERAVQSLRGFLASMG